MVKRIHARIARDYPDYLELNHLAALAEQAWPRFGISLPELSQYDRWQIELVRVLLAQ